MKASIEGGQGGVQSTALSLKHGTLVRQLGLGNGVFQDEVVGLCPSAGHEEAQSPDCQLAVSARWAAGKAQGIEAELGSIVLVHAPRFLTQVKTFMVAAMPSTDVPANSPPGTALGSNASQPDPEPAGSRIEPDAGGSSNTPVAISIESLCVAAVSVPGSQAEAIVLRLSQVSASWGPLRALTPPSGFWAALLSRQSGRLPAQGMILSIPSIGLGICHQWDTAASRKMSSMAAVEDVLDAPVELQALAFRQSPGILLCL